MPLNSASASATPAPSTDTDGTFAVTGSRPEGFVERRKSGGRRAGGRNASGRDGGAERRQFGSSHNGLSPEGRELAQAIDRYKVENHRRYITCDEMLKILQTLGYRRSDEDAEGAVAPAMAEVT